MYKDDNMIPQTISQLNLRNAIQPSKYRSMDQINDVADSGRTNRKMDVQQERRTIAQLTRDDLEDKYLRLTEDYQTLKSHARQQEAKITSLATKLRKVTDDIKRKENYPSNMLLMKEDLDNYKLKSEMLENQNMILKGKIQVLHGQLMTDTKRPSAYDKVPSRINSGVAKRLNNGPDLRRQNNLRMLKPAGENNTYSSMKTNPNVGYSNLQLTNILDELHDDIREKDMTINHLSNKLNINQYDPRDKRSRVDENIELINLNKAMNDKRIQLEEMRAQYADLEFKQRKLERTNYELIDEIERLQGGGAFSRASSIESSGLLKRRIQELEAVVDDHKREVAVLKETNEKLTNSAFDAVREHEWREKEKLYRTQLAQLELTQRRDIGEKGSVLDRLGRERSMVDNMEKEISKLQLEKYELEGKLREKDNKLRFVDKQGDVSSQDIEEALLLIQNRKRLLKSTPDLHFLQKVDRENDKVLLRKLHDLEINHAETIQELEKTRCLLQTQYKFTNNYKQESEKQSDRLKEIRKDYEERLSTYAQLLDIRAARIQKLEAQLKDIAYGTKTPMVDEIENNDEMDSPMVASLERGENILEVQISRVCLTKQALAIIGDSEPFLFGTWDFYDFETQATGLIRGTNPEFDIKAEYLVKIDDFFLNYLYKNSFLFELHQAIGTEFVTLASCQMSCKEIMDRPAEKDRFMPLNNGLKLNCKARLMGTREDLTEVNIGVLEYWVRLRYPMDQIIRQYREKLKAEGYIMANEKSIIEAQLPSDRPMENMNELIIRVLRCNAVNSHQRDLQPSPYLCYKFLDYNEHVSITIASSNNPEFHDLKRFPVQMEAQLHQYLKSQNLKIYLIDDLDPESSRYLGIVVVPLIPLSSNNKIIGSFELYDAANKKNGTMDLEMEWMYSYLFTDEISERENESVSMLPGEREDLSNKTPVKDVSKLTKRKENKPIVKDMKQKGLKAEPKKDIKEAPVSPRKSIMKTKPKAHVAKKRVSETLKNQEIVEMLRMPDVENIVVFESPVDSIHEEITMTKRQHKVNNTKDSLNDSLQNIDQQMSKDNAPIKTVAEDVKPPVKAPRSLKVALGTKKHASDTTCNNTEVLDNDVVIVTKSHKNKSKTDLNPDEIIVEIISVEIEDDADILDDNNVQLLFAAYRIPGIHSVETESSSVAKPISSQENKRMSFNFRKTFDVSYERNYKVRQHIAVMLTEESKKDIVFNLVKEPDDDEEDCEDIGIARLNVRTILVEKKNVENGIIAIHSLDDEEIVIGHMEVTVNMLGVLMAIESELESG